VRYVAGNSHKPIVGQLALQALEEEEHNAAGRAEIFCSSIFQERELRGAVHSGSAGRTRAIVKVQDGCNANCSFCIIPSVRGRSRSMDPARVVEDVQALVHRGYKEVVFSGIHLGSYGRDILPRTSLAELITRTIDDVRELARLRLSSIEPLEVTPELIDLVGRHPRMAHHFHVPLQSGSRRILREMRRPYAPEYYADLVSRIRSSIDDAAIGADVMVGFPGETDREFAETYELIENSPLTYLHVFPYSARPGTPAADMSHRIPQHVSRARANALREMIGRKNEAFRRSMINRALDVLVLQTGEGLTSNFLRVRVADALPANEWVRLQVTGLDEDGLTASNTTTAQDIN
jgi:threonylcarbamoyladenosine tRNA methylthiotransferase MtaB